jgi:fructose-bisphosphate aldolase class I
MKGNIGGVILFDETIRQTAADGTSLVDVINSQGSLPGIKVDKGLQQIGDTEESLTQGLEGLDDRLKEYYEIGAKFTKWRAVINIGKDMPSSEAISANMEALAEYAKIVQNNNMVPMVEPEVLMDGNHSIDDCLEATSRCLDTLFICLLDKAVDLKATILKPNMITSGSNNSDQADVEEVAQKTIDCLKAYVPDDLPGITFLSGGQSDIDATAHLDAMNKIGGFNWKLSFSYGRALQQPALKAWMGKKENIILAQQALSHRALMNKLASEGKWDISLEN